MQFYKNVQIVDTTSAYIAFKKSDGEGLSRVRKYIVDRIEYKPFDRTIKTEFISANGTGKALTLYTWNHLISTTGKV